LNEGARLTFSDLDVLSGSIKGSAKNTILDRYFQEFVEKFDHNPGVAEYLLKNLMYDIHSIDPDIFMDTLTSTIIKNPTSEKSLTLRDIFYYAHSPESDAYTDRPVRSDFQDTIRKKLDFSNPEMFGQTGNLLIFLNQVLDNPDETFRIKVVTQDIGGYLEEAMEDEQGSYFLSLLGKNIARKVHRKRMRQFYPDVSFGETTPPDDLNRDTIKNVSLKNFIDEGVEFSEQEVGDFVFFHEILKDFVMKDLQIDLTKIPLKQRFQFLNFIKLKPAAEMDQVRNMTQRYGELALRSFLSLEQDKTTGDDIIYLSEQLDEEGAKALFQKYSDLVDTADEVEQYIKSHVSPESVTQDGIMRVRNTILGQGKDLLKQFSGEIRKDGIEENPTEVILEKLDRINREGVLFTQTVRGLDGVELQDMIGASFEEVSPQNIPSDQKVFMRSLYEKNYTTTPRTQKKLLEGFDDLLNKDGVTFQVFKDGDNIKGFYALEEVGEKRLAWKALNLDHSYTGVRLGEELMLKGVDKASDHSIIEGQCVGDNFISSTYIERGFIATEVFSIEDEFDHIIKIVRNESQNHQFETKELSRDDIKKKALEQKFEVSDRDRNPKLYFIKSKMSEHDYELLTRDEGWVLTRSVSDRETGEVYLAYEQIEKEEVEKYKTVFHDDSSDV